jgi:tetratricopeptide (TPR) repeat protein
MGLPARSLARLQSSLLLAALVVAAGDALAARGPLAGPLPPQPQSALRLAHDLPRLREWIDAVDRHNPGQPDAAAMRVASWSRAQLEVLFLDIKALLQLITTPDRQRFPRALRDFTLPELQELQGLAIREAQRVADHPVELQELAGTHLVTWQLTAGDARRAVNRLLKRATLLHTDIALLVPSAADGPIFCISRLTTECAAESRVPVPRPLLAPRTSVQVEDGRQVGVTYYGAHWDFARLLLDEVTPHPAGDVTVRQWYRAVAALFAIEHLMAESHVHLERARQLFPADPEIAAATGRLHETYASPGIQHFLETGAHADAPVLIGSSRSNLRQAETFFSRAVELDSSFAVSRLHLGRVLGLEGHHEDAANELRRVAATAGDPLTQYYAWLFLGVEEQSLGRLDPARESFDKAASLYPRAQSPYLALSQLARRRGDRLGALRAIQQVLALSADDRQREDPWWTYLAGSAEQAWTLLSETRAVLFLTLEER